MGYGRVAGDRDSGRDFTHRQVSDL